MLAETIGALGEKLLSCTEATEKAHPLPELDARLYYFLAKYHLLTESLSRMIRRTSTSKEQIVRDVPLSLRNGHPVGALYEV